MLKFYKYEINISSLVVHDGEDILSEENVSKYCNLTYPKTNRQINKSMAIVYFSKDTLDLFDEHAGDIQLFLLSDTINTYEITPTDIIHSLDNDMIVPEEYEYMLRTNDKIFASKLKLRV